MPTRSLIAFAALASSSVSMCSPPPPASLICMLDSSASFNEHREQAIEMTTHLAGRLDPQSDQIAVFRMAGEVYWLYNNEKPNVKKLKHDLAGYVQVHADDKGTAYGMALARGIAEARDAAARQERAAVIVMGDGEDERSNLGANVDWRKLPRQFEDFPPDAGLFFLFIEPKAGNRYRDALKPILGDRLALFTPEATLDGTAARKIIQFIGH